MFVLSADTDFECEGDVQSSGSSSAGKIVEFVNEVLELRGRVIRRRASNLTLLDASASLPPGPPATCILNFA